MSEPPAGTIATRGGQMFPTLAQAEIARLRRFGVERRYRAGEALATVGEPGHGLSLITSGAVEISRSDDVSLA